MRKDFSIVQAAPYGHVPCRDKVKCRNGRHGAFLTRRMIMRMFHDVVDVLQSTFALMAGLRSDMPDRASVRPADNDNGPDADPERRYRAA